MMGDAAEALPVVAIFVAKETGFDDVTLIAVGENAHDRGQGKPEQTSRCFR